MAVKTQRPNTKSPGARDTLPSRSPETSVPTGTPLGLPGGLANPDIKKFQAMLDQNPASRIFASLAELYRKQGMFDEAINLCLRGLTFNPGYLSGHVVLGLAYFDKGMIKQAAEELEQVVSAKPDHLMATKVLGDVLLMNGDIDRAKYYFERVLAMAPDDLDVKKKLDPMQTKHEQAQSRTAPEKPETPAAEIIEGDALEIVENEPPPVDIPEAQIITDDTPPAGEVGLDLSADDISDILVNTEQRIHEIETRRDTPVAAAQKPDEAAAPRFRSAAAEGVLPLYRAVERLQIGILITDLDGTVHYANRAVAASHGWEKEELAGRHINDFFPPGLFVPMTMHEILEKRSLARDTMNRRKDGSVFPVRTTYDTVENDAHEPIYIIIGIDDLTRRREIDEDLWQLSIKDAETGLFNRRHFLAKIAEEVKRAERMKYALCLMIFVINDFKSYQTVHGPKKGERVLAEMGKLTRQSIRREVDSAYRITEDEFAVILPTATEKKSHIVADRLREKISKRLPDIDIRVGMASIEEHKSIEELIAAAEKAMYKSREANNRSE